MRALRVAAGAIALLAGGSAHVFAAGREFDRLLSEVSQRYEIRPTRVPLMGFVSLCARVVSHGGVRNLHVAEFDNLKAPLDLSALAALVRTSVGSDWQPFVIERSRNGGEQSVIFVRPAGNTMRMLIADYARGELDLVEMELNGDALAKWMNKPGEAR